MCVCFCVCACEGARVPACVFAHKPEYVFLVSLNLITQVAHKWSVSKVILPAWRAPALVELDDTKVMEWHFSEM